MSILLQFRVIDTHDVTKGLQSEAQEFQFYYSFVRSTRTIDNVTMLRVRALSTWWQSGSCLSWNPEAKGWQFFCFLNTVFVAARDHNTVDSLVMCGPVLLTFHDICHHKCRALKLCFFLSLMTWCLSPPRNQEAKDEPVVFNLDNGCRTLTNTMWPVVQFYFSNMSSPSAVSVAIWIPSSASTPQVGFLCKSTSSTWEETSKFQLRRRKVEVPCSGVPLGSLARFWGGCRLWEINSRVWESKRIEEISIIGHQCLRQSLIANWFQSWCFVVVVDVACRFG